jgi:putative FmdB family regulatory protein
MPNYSYECNHCNKKFELFFYIKDYQEQPKCSYCKSRKTNRLYTIDAASQITSVRKSDGELKTLGDLANRNRDRLSNDQKQALYKNHNSYKEEESKKQLPSGMTRLKKQPKTKWT